MPRHAFFCFHRERDRWRADQVRKSWIERDTSESGFPDPAEWSAILDGGDEALDAWIDQQLEGTTVTVVLVGAETAEQDHVLSEIEKSYDRGNGLVVIFINGMLDQGGARDKKGANPLADFQVDHDRVKVPLSKLYPAYDWVTDMGRMNLNAWIEDAARRANKA